MCGFVFKLNFGSGDFNKNKFEQAMDFIQRRGPDYSGFKFFEKHPNFNFCSLGHKRLSIIDINESSNQPLQYNGLHIIFNGEIYNYLELKNKLKGKGYFFQSTGDTEVLLKLFYEYKEKCLDYLDGMFSFLIFNEATGDVFFARDSYGEKPLYFAFDNDCLSVSSDIDSIRVMSNKDSLSLNNSFILNYLSLGYQINSLSTPYNEIKKVEPSSYFFFNCKEKKLSKNSYDYSAIDGKNISNRLDYLDVLDEIMNSSVETRLRSDVPVGVFLSGGIDSSLISYYASRLSPNITGFNIDFSGQGFSETDFARKISRHLEIDFKSYTPNETDYQHTAREIPLILDEPISDVSILPQTIISNFLKQHVKVVLSGDGADEIFGGYEFFNSSIWNKYYIGNFGKRISKTIQDSLLHKFPRIKFSSKAHIFLALLRNESSIKNSLYWNSITPKLLHDFINCNQDFFSEEEESIEDLLCFYQRNYLSNNILKKVDRATMFHSIESRAPFLSRGISSFAKSINSKFLISKSENKIILKQLAYSKIPQSLFTPQKNGFVPSVQHIINNPLRTWTNDGLEIFREKIISLFGRDFYVEYLELGNKSNHRDAYRRWAFSVLGHWLYERN